MLPVHGVAESKSQTTQPLNDDNSERNCSVCLRSTFLYFLGGDTSVEGQKLPSIFFPIVFPPSTKSWECLCRKLWNRGCDNIAGPREPWVQPPGGDHWKRALFCLAKGVSVSITILPGQEASARVLQRMSRFLDTQSTEKQLGIQQLGPWPQVVSFPDSYDSFLSWKPKISLITSETKKAQTHTISCVQVCLSH